MGARIGRLMVRLLFNLVALKVCSLKVTICVRPAKGQRDDVIDAF
jgi:hypothetical protein